MSSQMDDRLNRARQSLEAGSRLLEGLAQKPSQHMHGEPLRSVQEALGKIVWSLDPAMSDRGLSLPDLSTPLPAPTLHASADRPEYCQFDPADNESFLAACNQRLDILEASIDEAAASPVT